MMNYGMSDLLGRIERDTQCIQWALVGRLNGQSKRIFIDRRMASLKSSYAKLNGLSEAQETELLASVKLPISLFPTTPAAPQEQQQKEDTEVKSREQMALERKNAQLTYAAWLYAVTRLPIGTAQAKVAVSCFGKIQKYYNELTEIMGENQAEETLAEIMAEVHAADQAVEEQEKPVMVAEQLE